MDSHRRNKASQHISRLVALSCCLVVSALSAAWAQSPKLELIASDLISPIDVATLPDNTDRRLILDQSGVVHLLNSDNSLASEPYLDIRDRLLPLREDFEERGLLGMAIHPHYNHNGKVFVTYSAPLADDAPANWNHTRIVSEFTIDSTNPDQLDTNSERILIRLHWPSRKHNGGALAFGHDGYLYIGFGDGGGIHGVGPETLNDAWSVPQSRMHWDSTAQDLQSLYGKLLRINIDAGFPGYAIPEDNPLVGKLGRNEIYAWGFRNPFRVSFDPDQSGSLYITAVAETLWEAIYRIDAPGNYGWPIKEASHCFDRTRPLDPPASCDHTADINDPVIEYPNMSVHREGSKVEVTGVGTAVVGAVMQRDGEPEAWNNHLLFADWSLDFRKPSGQLFLAAENSSTPWQYEQIITFESRIIGLVQDTDGRRYILSSDNFGPYGLTGKVWELKFQ